MLSICRCVISYRMVFFLCIRRIDVFQEDFLIICYRKEKENENLFIVY